MYVLAQKRGSTKQNTKLNEQQRLRSDELYIFFDFFVDLQRYYVKQIKQERFF